MTLPSMALKKFPRVFATWISGWTHKRNPGVLIGLGCRSRGCACISPEQPYSRRQIFTNDELYARTKILAKHFTSTPEAEFHHFLTNNQQLVTMGREKFCHLTELLARHGITAKELFIYPNIYRRKCETVSGRIRQLEEGGVKPVTLRMINTTYKKYMSVCLRLIMDAETHEVFKSTVQLLCQELGFSESEAEKKLHEAEWLRTSKLRSVKEKIELFRSYGVTCEALRDRLWVLAFPVSMIKARLDTLKLSDIIFEDFPKSYLSAITSDDDKYRKFKERLIENKAILQEAKCRDKQEYICARLGIDKATLAQIVKKNTTLLSIRLPKLRTNLDILLKGFLVPASLVVKYPRILSLSTTTLQERLQQMQDLSMPITGSILSSTNSDYQTLMAKHLNK